MKINIGDKFQINGWIKRLNKDKLKVFLYSSMKEGTVLSKEECMSTIETNEIKHGRWFLLDECSNAGVYCSVCNKKVYKTNYANQN